MRRLEHTRQPTHIRLPEAVDMPQANTPRHAKRSPICSASTSARLRGPINLASDHCHGQGVAAGLCSAKARRLYNRPTDWRRV